MKQQHQEIKILGTTICESLKEAILNNWHEIVQKMQNHINKLSLRQLSLFGKGKILNSLILTKTTFLSNVFPIPEKKITEIYKNIFKYLWQNKKQEPIARKTLLLQKEKGCLNIKEPEAHNIAMRIKHLLSLKQQRKTAILDVYSYILASERYL